MFVDSALNEGGTFDVRAVTSAWTEDTLDGADAPSLGDVAASAIPAGPAQTLNFISIDLTGLV